MKVLSHNADVPRRQATGGKPRLCNSSQYLRAKRQKEGLIQSPAGAIDITPDDEKQGEAHNAQKSIANYRRRHLRMMEAVTPVNNREIVTEYSKD